MTVVIIAVLSAVAVSTFGGTKERTADSGSERLLESVAATQEGYHRSRGEFATTSDALATLSSETVTLTTGPSTSDAVVSIAPVAGDETEQLALAVLSRSGKCLTLVIPAPGSGSSGTDPVRSTPMGSAMCSAELAASS